MGRKEWLPWRADEGQVGRRRRCPPSVVAAGFGAWLLRHVSVRWGAASSEARDALPGDDLVQVPDYAATNATTVRVKARDIGQWLVQMGAYTRAGWYSFDRFDNGRVPGAWEIVPELQHLQVGDVLPTDRDGTGFVVERLDPPHAMVLTIRTQGTVTSSAFVLHEQDGCTRLLCRLRLTAPRTMVGVRYRLLMEVGHVPMTLAMLRGIRRPAERAQPRGPSDRRPVDSLPRVQLDQQPTRG